MSIGLTIGAGLAIAGAVGGAGAIVGGVLSSSAATNAANAQVSGADYAANLQKQEADQALAFQQQQYDTAQAQIKPWIDTGTTALNQLNGGTLPSFQAPTGATESNDPGYQFRLQQGQQALENSAAARGGLLTGNTGQALEQYGQNYASNEYGNVYNRAMNDYNTNVLGPYNRLSALAGVGQQAQATSAQQGQNAANTVTNIDLTAGQQQGQDAQNAAAARASGYVGSANAWNSALGGVSNSLTNTLLLNKLYGG
jgi:hypothetical protein